MKRGLWWIWLAEYPDEGMVVYEAMSAAQAKRLAFKTFEARPRELGSKRVTEDDVGDLQDQVEALMIALEKAVSGSVAIYAAKEK